VRLAIMHELVTAKFQHQELASLLLCTDDALLVEKNRWGDVFWGTNLDGRGANWLGRILMLVRSKLILERGERS